MAHLFISYSRNDRPVIEKLSVVLEEAGHSVWWDRHIRGGAAFAKDIESQLQKADAIIVAWSSDANVSDWVKDEAVFARDKGKLIPICLTDCEAPMGFRQYQTIDFQHWKGDPAAPALHSILSAIAEISGADAPVAPPPIKQTLLQKFLTKMPYQLGAGAAALALAVIITVIVMGRGGPTAEEEARAANTLPGPAQVSIAVLPFADMSAEGNQGHFARGLSEELLNLLVTVEGLGVASRTSSFTYTENKIEELNIDIEDIASRLKVNHILEGSVRKMGDDLRITAQLINARDNKHLWSETFDRKSTDIFRIQDEIATAVVEQLRTEFGIEAPISPIVKKRDTQNISAYELYLEARELYLERNAGRAVVEESLFLFERVVELDPAFARGWEGLAAVYGVATSYGILDRDYSALALVANKKALALDPDLSMPYAVIGLTYRGHYPTPWAESFENLNKAIDRDPKNISAWQWLGMNYIAIGAHEEAIKAFTTCLELEEKRLQCGRYRSVSNFVLGNIDAAMADANLNAEQNYFRGYDVYLPYFLEQEDRMMAFAASRMVNWRPGFPHHELISALENPSDQPPERLQTFKNWGKEKRVDILDNTNLMLALRNYDEINVGTFDNDYVYLWLPHYSHYRNTPQFKKLAQDLGLVDYWRESGFPPQCRVMSDTDFECD